MEDRSVHLDFTRFLEQNPELECDSLEANGKLTEVGSEFILSNSWQAEMTAGLRLCHHPLPESLFNHGHNATPTAELITLNPDLSDAILNSDLPETTAQLDLFGCMDNEKEAEELLTGLFETEKEMKGMLDEVSLTDMLFEQPSTLHVHEQPSILHIHEQPSTLHKDSSTLHIHEQPSIFPQETSLEHLLSQPITQPRRPHHHLSLTQHDYENGLYSMPTLPLNAHYSTLEQEFILANHPQLKELRDFLRIKCSRVSHHEISTGEDGVPSLAPCRVNVGQLKQSIVTTAHISGAEHVNTIDQNYTQGLDCKDHLSNMASGNSEADRVMMVAVATTRDLTNSKRFIDQMERVDEDCTTILSSVSSFCRDLLKTAKEDDDGWGNKENKQELLANTSNSLCTKDQRKTKSSEKEVTGSSSKGLCSTHQMENSCIESEEQDTAGTDLGCIRNRVSKRTTATSQRRTREHISKKSTDILQQWLIEHADHPYPDDDEKEELCLRTDLTLVKLSQWFVNGRRRVLASVGLHVPRGKR